MAIDKCPLCDSEPTRFGDSWSDGEEWSKRPFRLQQCSNPACQLPCRLWQKVAEQAGEIERLETMLADMPVVSVVGPVCLDSECSSGRTLVADSLPKGQASAKLLYYLVIHLRSTEPMKVIQNTTGGVVLSASADSAAIEAVARKTRELFGWKGR